MASQAALAFRTGNPSVPLPASSADAFAKALEGQGVELIRSDLSVQEQDQVRAALGDSGATDQPK
jgi:hypothetical protein